MKSILTGLLLAVACALTGCDDRRSNNRQEAGAEPARDVANKTAGFGAGRTNETIDLGAGVKMEFVLIPAGSFQIGTKEGTTDQFEDEKPAHKVALTKPFYLGKYEVTQEQWLKVMDNNPSEFKGPELPVENVRWDDLQSFLTKLREKSGRNITLPTEAQWEYACRAGTDTRYSCGDRDEDLVEHAWFADNSYGLTHPVGELEPNAWGLYDMSGNAWEWCADSYGPYSDGEAIDPFVSTSSRIHVVRGGACTSKTGGMRPSNRNSDWRGIRFFGFRCAIPVDETAR